MSQWLVNKLRTVLAGLLVVGGTAFATVPTDGCNGEIRIVIDDQTGLTDSGDVTDVDVEPIDEPVYEPVDDVYWWGGSFATATAWSPSVY